MKAIEQYFPVVLKIMLYKVQNTFESLSAWTCILNSGHSKKKLNGYFPVLLSTKFKAGA